MKRAWLLGAAMIASIAGWSTEGGSFAIKQMTQWGLHCILLRDLTDAMYGPQDAPHVSHQQGTELVVEYIEKYWSPTAVSNDFSHALSEQ